MCTFNKGRSTMVGVVETTRLDLSATDLREAAKQEKNATVVRRILAIALVLDGADRKSAAETCGMDRQTLQVWVHHSNREGLSGLRERRTSNRKSALTLDLEPTFAALVEQGPNPAIDGVVRWRRVDLQRVQKERFGIEVKVSAESHKVDESDFELMKSHGFSEEDCWDIAGITAFFSLSNRMANVTNMRPNDEFYMLGR
jgi:transposase